MGAENKRDKLCTVKQLAKEMGVTPTKLYYHVKMLEEHGLLVVGDTRVVSGIIEKQYQVIALDISFSQNALSLSDKPKDEALQEIFNSVDQIINNSMYNLRSSLTTIYEEKRAEKDGGSTARKQSAMQISSDELLLTHDQAEEYKALLLELMDKYKELSDKNLQAANEEILSFEITQMFIPQYQRTKTKQEK